MKALYKNLGYTIGGYAGVTMPIVDPKKQIAPDTVLVGRYGWIFQCRDPMRVGVVRCSSRKGEKVKYLNLKHIRKALFGIGYFTDLVKQAEYANNPNLRYEAVDEEDRVAEVAHAQIDYR